MVESDASNDSFSFLLLLTFPLSLHSSRRGNIFCCYLFFTLSLMSRFVTVLTVRMFRFSFRNVAFHLSHYPSSLSLSLSLTFPPALTHSLSTLWPIETLHSHWRFRSYSQSLIFLSPSLAFLLTHWASRKKTSSDLFVPNQFCVEQRNVNTSRASGRREKERWRERS